jgi:hypothetical protein
MEEQVSLKYWVAKIIACHSEDARNHVLYLQGPWCISSADGFIECFSTMFGTVGPPYMSITVGGPQLLGAKH